MDTEPKQPKSKFTKTTVFKVLGTLFAIAIIATGAFFYKAQRDSNQKSLHDSQAKVINLQKQSANLQNSLKAANAHIDELEAAAAKAGAVPAVQKLSLKITGVTKDSRGYGYSGDYTHQQITVDVSLTNNTTSELSFSLNDFKLKDGDNIIYTPSGDNAWPPAANKRALKAQSISPGETLTGSMSFEAVPITFSSFRFYYLDNLTTVTPDNATYGWYTYPWCKGIEGTGQMGC